MPTLLARMCGGITSFLRAALLVAMMALVALAGASILGDLGLDTDNDGIPDAVEITEGTNPSVKDNDVFASNRLLVMQVYRDFLGREADAGGLAFWQGQLDSGMDRSSFIEGVQGQPEFQARVAPMIRLYLTAFNRRPDHGGLTFWARQFASGTSLQTIATAFAGSPEFLATYGALTNRQFIELLYLNTLNRPGDVRGVDFWTAQLEGGFQTRGQMLVTFSESPENIGVSEPEVLVAMAYAGMLNRTADAGGFIFWVDRVTLAFDRIGLIRAFFLSQEYRNRFLPPPTPPTFTGANATTFYVGAPGTFTVAATGVPNPTVAVSGALPAGVTFNPATRLLSGTPAAGTAGTYPLTFTAANGVPPDATQSFTLTVSPAVAITSAASTTFTVGTAGTFTVTTASTPVAGTITQTGALPSGVTFVNNGNGTASLAGTPAAGTGGTYPITITAANGVAANGTQNFTLTVNQAPAITSANAATFPLGAAGTHTVTATGFPAPTLSMTGALPSGVTFNPTTGVLSGTPAAGTGGTYPLVFTAANGIAPDGTQSFTLNVNLAPAITSANAATFMIGVAGTFAVTTTGVPAPSVGVTGALPSGVTFAGNVLSGTPASGTNGTYPLTFTASNGVAPDAVQGFTLTVNLAPVNNPPTATAFANLPAQAGIPITYSAGKLAGADPEGTTIVIDTTPINVTNGTVTINADGSFTFTPFAVAAAASFQYRVSDTGIPAPLSSAYATVSFTVAGPAIFFVKNPAVGLANCTLGNECLFATAISNIGATPNASIFIGDANSHTAGSTLNPNGRVIGQGITGTTFDTFFGIGAPAEGALAARPLVAQARPIVTAAAGATLTLGSNNTLRGFDLGNTSPAGTGLSGTAFGTLTASDMAVGTTGSAFSLTTGTAAVTFDAVVSSGGTNNVNLNAVAGSLAMGGGSLAGATGDAFNVVGGTGSITYNGTVASGAARSVSIASKTGGTVTFNGAVTDTDTGISLTNNAGATIAFTGGVSLSTGANTAFAATGGGTVTATQNNTSIVNTIATTTATALNVANTTIGAADLTFRSISSNGGTATGIILDTTGSSGSLVVTGNGGAGTGGTIANKAGTDGQAATGIGIYLNSTLDPSFSWMQLNDFGNYAIRGFLVNGLTLDRMVINGTNGSTELIGGVSSPEGSVAFGSGAGESGGAVNGLVGSATISNSSISGAFTTNFRVVNQSGILNRITFNTVSIGANSTANGNDGVQLQPEGTATIMATVTASTFTSARGDLLHYVDNGSGANQDLVLTSNAFSNNHPAIATGGGGVTISSGNNNNLALTINSNSFRDAVGTGVLIVKPTGTGTLSGTFSNNSIGVAAAANSGSAEGSGLKVQTVGEGTITMSITDNQIYQYNNFGIELLAGGGAVMQGGAFNTTITGNTIANPGNTAGTLTIPKQGIHLNIGTVPGDTYAACSGISGNTIASSGADSVPPTIDVDVRMRQRQSTTIRLPGYAGGATDTAAVQLFVAGNNPGGTAVLAAANSPPGGGYTGGAACPLP